MLQTDRQTNFFLECVDFFFKLNLLPPYLLCSQGITKNIINIIRLISFLKMGLNWFFVFEFAKLRTNSFIFRMEFT